MNVKVDSLLLGACKAVGGVVIIDVFRAFTTAAVALANGASRIIMVSGVEEAIALRKDGAAELCMGEIEGVPPKEFDIGNSPYEIAKTDFSGKTIVQRTSAGTLGIVAARKAEVLYAGSLVTARATVRSLLSQSPAQVTLVAMGKKAATRTDEDELCAMHMCNLLEGRPGNADAARQMIMAGSQVQRFFDPSKTHLHPQDLDIALDIDRYDFAIRVKIEDGNPVARAEGLVKTGS